MNNQQIIIIMLSSFVGCFAALTIFAIFIGVMVFPLADAAINQLAIRVEGELNKAEVTCTDTYIDGAIPLIIHDQREFCQIGRQDYK